MTSDRARQKKLEKHRKARAAAQKKAKSPSLPTSRADLERAAERWPIVSAWLGGDRDDAEHVALLTALVVRRCPDGRLLVSTALVDRARLGVKDGHTMQPMTEDELGGLLDRVREMNDGVLEEVSFDVLRAVVFRAIDHAATLGFSPPSDFPLALFGPRPAVLPETLLREPQRSADDEDDDDDDADADDDDNELEGAASQLKRFAQPLILSSDGSREAMQRVFALASFYWNLALEDDPLRSPMLQVEVDRLSSDAARARFLDVARTMVERHRALFPEMHRARR